MMIDKRVEFSDWHRLNPDEVTARLQSSDLGLSPEEARKRLERFGPNELIEKKHKSPWMMFLDQFKDFMILVLIAAALVAGVIGEPSDTIAIAVIVLLNAVLGFRSGIPRRKGHGGPEEAGGPLHDHYPKRPTRNDPCGPAGSRRSDSVGVRPGGTSRYPPD